MVHLNHYETYEKILHIWGVLAANKVWGHDWYKVKFPLSFAMLGSVLFEQNKYFQFYLQSLWIKELLYFICSVCNQ